MVDEERRFAVKGWLPTLVRSLVQVACSEPSESDRPSLSYLLRLIAQNEILNDIKSNFGEDVLDSLTSYINNLKDRYADLSPEGDGRVNELLYCDASEKLKPPKKRRRRFFYKKRSSRGRKWIESDDDTVSEDSDGRVPPIWGTDSRRAVPQARNLLFSDSDGLSAVYAEIHSLTYADMTFSGAHTISKLKRMFPGFNDEALFSSDAAQFRLSIVVMARFLTDSTRRHFLGLLETYFGSLETFLPQTLTFAIDVLNWLLVTTVTDHFEDAHFVEFVLKLIVSILQKCYEISPSDEKSADGVEHLYRAVDTSLQAFFYSSYRGFALNGELLTSGFEYLVNFQTNKVIQTVANLIPLVHHNSLNEKCCCKHFFTLVKRSSALADNECKSRLTSLLLHNVHMNILCSCIETLEIIEFLCALIEPSNISEGLGQLCTHFLRSRRGSELNELKEHGLSIFDQLISRFESDYNLTDITFLNDILSALSSLDDVSYLVETCVLQNLIRISGQGSEQTLAGGHERFVELIKVLVSFMDTSICCLAVNDVILANVPTFLALTVESDVFPKTVSMLIKKATADRSEELLQAMCKQLDESMRVASSDIWVLVSASAMSFFKKLVALLELFNLVQEELPPDVASKLVSDSQRLVNLCCEYFAHPLKDFRSNYRLTQLLALTLRFSSDPEVLSGITEAIRESSECAFSFVASTLPSALLDSALGIGANSVIQSTPSEVVERESEYDESVAASSPGTEFTFAVKSDDTYFLLVSIDCIHAMTEKYEKFNEHLEFALKTFAERMRPLRFEDVRRLSKCIDKLLDLCDLCVAKNASSSTFDSLVACVMYLISQEPSTEHIYRVFRSFDSYHPFQTSVVKALNRIFDSQPFQDCTMLRFPVQNSPSFESQSIQEHVAKESDPISSKKVTTIQRSLTVIGALERFFTGSNSTKRASESDLKSLATNSAGVFSEENFFVPSAAALLSFDTANLTALSEGLSAAFWIRLRETELEDLFHVLSVGDSAVHASLLVSPCEKRIVITISNGGVVVARKSVKRQVSTSRWTHTVLTFRVVDNHASASLLIGDSLHEICYDIVPECTEDGHGSALIYGSVTFGAISQVICSWQYEISSIFGFKGVLSPTAALVLRAFGFQTNSITRCLSDSQQIPRLSSVFTKAVLSSKRFHLGALLNDCDKFVQLLQRGLLFVFRCDTPEVYGLSGLQPGVNSHLFGDVRKDGDSSLFSLIAFREFPISWRTSQYSLAVDRSLDDIVYTFGSIKLFLFCYAQSVDLIMDDEAQLAVLRVVFKSLQRDPRDYTRFKQMKGENILIAILSNSFAALNWDIFYEIVRSLVSDLSLSGDGTITVAWTSTILDPEFLIKFAFYSKIWKKNRIVYWVELLRIIAACAREDVKFHEFNILQLKRVNFLQSMLHAVVEMLQSSSDFCVWNNIEQLIDSLKVLIRTFVDSPGTADTVIALWNFILLSHTAANTYVLSNIEGYNNWLQIGSMRCPESEPVIPGETPLSSLLSNIYETLGKNRVSEIWKKTASVTAIRKVFRECLQVQNGIDRGWTDSSVSLESTLASTHNISKETITGDDGNLEAGEESEETNEGSSQTFLDELQLMTSGTGWIADLRAAIFEILCSLLVTASDDLMKVLFSNAAFHWDSALVLLTSQTDARIRDCVFMFLHKFFLRCSPSIRLSFIASDGFVLLGNQMRNHQVTEIITDALFGILCNSAVKLSDGLDETHLASLSIDRFTCASLHALFVLFEESVSDSALFWNVGGALQKIFESNSILMQAMMDAGLIEIMSSALYRITKLPEETCDLFGVHYLSNRGEMWHSFACRIVSRCVPFDELSMYNKCEEFLWLCLMADWQSSLDGRNSDFVREQLSGLVLHWINTISSSVQKEGRSASTVPSLEDVHTGISSNDTDSFVDDYEILSMESISAGNQFSDLSNANDPSPAFPFSQSFNDLKDRFLGTQNVSRLLKVKYKWQNKSVLANPTDLSHRVSFALEMASHLLVSLALPQNASEVEMELFQLVLTIFCSSWTESCTQKRSSRRVGSDCPTITWSGLLSVSRDRVHVLFAQLIAFALYPAQLKCRVLNGQMCSDSESQYVAHRQFGIVASLCYEVNCKQMLRTLLDINLDGQYAMNVALHEMALFPSESDDRRDRCIDQLVTFLRNVQIESPFANLSFDGINSLIQDEIISLHSYSSHRKTFFDRMRSKATEIVDRESKATDRISMDAMGVTCKVTESQNVFRKAFMRQLRSMETTHYEAEKMLMALTAELSHLEGCGLRKKAWFESWSLDSSEGPHRERRKLVPTHAMYSERFVLEEFRDRLQARLEKPPLSSLFHGEAADLASRLHRVEISEGIRYSVGATVVRSTFECFGEVLVGDAKLYFFGETAKSTQKGTQCSTITFSWNYTDVTEVFKRDYLLEDTALEIFLSSGDAYLIVFSSLEVRETFLGHISQMPLPRLISAVSSDTAEATLLNLTQRWRCGILTNFEYLMHLNTFAGRSYNDLMQYPIMPFIISDFKSVVLDLESPSVYRNLAKPMAIQDKTMEDHYLRNFHCLESESRKHSPEGTSIVNFGPYHYGSHYSNSGIVVHYLVRLSPFTNIALEYQDNNFDIADRLFNSIETTWRLASSESTTDFKEAIPEFFYLPEFLQNLNKLDLGVKQNGDRVDNVILPQWCPQRDNALGYRLFCFIHRQALESSLVTSSLHNWIDLIFGYKQTGEASVKAINVFHPATYRDKKLELNGSIEHDELSVSALRTMVRTYGQMAIQLFSSPHLPHLNPRSSSANILAEKQRVPPNLFSTISGLRWGEFVGSPDGASGRISLVMTIQIHEKIERLFPFTDNIARCGGLPPKTIIWHKYSRERNYDEYPTWESRGVISWNFFDNVLRFKLVKTDDSVWINLVDFGSLQVSYVAVSYTKSFVFVGFTSGVVHAYHLKVTSSGFAMASLKREFFAHQTKISSISVCDEFGLIVTTDCLGKVCYWDLNKLEFIRSYKCSNEVQLSWISPTTGDVALILEEPDGNTDGRNTVVLLTINGVQVGSVSTSESIGSITMTNLPEGRAINCLLAGLTDGRIVVIEMWTMTIINEISHESVTDEIIGMQFSSHCKKLYTLLKSGWVHCWQCASGNRGKPPSFQFINPF